MLSRLSWWLNLGHWVAEAEITDLGDDPPRGSYKAHADRGRG